MFRGRRHGRVIGMAMGLAILGVGVSTQIPLIGCAAYVGLALFGVPRLRGSNSPNGL